MEEGTFGLGFEGRIGSLCMEMEDVRGEDSSEGWRKSDQRQGDRCGVASTV